MIVLILKIIISFKDFKEMDFFFKGGGKKKSSK